MDLSTTGKCIFPALLAHFDKIGEQERPTYLSVQQSLGRDVLRYVSQNSNRLKVERDLSENIEELPIFSALPGPSGDPNDTRGMAVSEVFNRDIY